MPNGENGKRWGEILYRTILMAMVIAGGGAAVNNAISAAKIETKILGHLESHPDVGLTTRLNMLRADHNRLENRVRLLEIRLGAYENE